MADTNGCVYFVPIATCGHEDRPRRLGCTNTVELKYVAQPYKTKVVPCGLCSYNPDVVVSLVGPQKSHVGGIEMSDVPIGIHDTKS